MICSFDVGFKNLAYCKMSYADGKFEICEWDVVNIIKDIKINVNDISAMCDALSIALNAINFEGCTKILIEHQPKMAKEVMKTLSIYIMCYFKIKYNIPVEFVNPGNKLKVYDGEFVPCKLKGQYARNKFYGKLYCEHFIKDNPEYMKIFTGYKKKDDLADCFLQGVWYLMTIHDKCHLKQIQTCDNSKKMYNSINVNKFINMKGMKPKSYTKNRFTLSELKYISDHKIISCDVSSSLCFYFGTPEFPNKVTDPPHNPAHNPTHNHNKYDKNLIKFKNMKKSTKPKTIKKIYTMTELKYIINKNVIDINKDVIDINKNVIDINKDVIDINKNVIDINNATYVSNLKSINNDINYEINESLMYYFGMCDISHV
jgi:hypothetical protein